VAQQATTSIEPAAPPRQTHLLREDAQWGWADLRDYVVGQIERLRGPFPRNDRNEMGIFKGFVSRHGERSAAIARYAFEDLKGWWRGAPVGVGRFARASDPYFADPIKVRLDG
jgi:hypothetical protein